MLHDTRGGGKLARGQSPLDDVLDRLPRVKRSPNGWIASCPAHDDRSPSLSIAEGDDGRVLLHDHAGCDAEDIVRALGLELRDLFPPTDTRKAFRRPLQPSPPYAMPKSVGKILLESAAFAEAWETSKALASVSEAQARQDVLASWDYLTSRSDLPAALSLARLMRGIAIFRYCDSKSVEDPAAVARAVRRLINDIEMWGGRSGSSVVPVRSPHSQKPSNTTTRSDVRNEQHPAT